MKFGADVIHLSARKADDDRINYPLVDATNATVAAAMVANWAAKRKYGEHGDHCVGSIAPASLDRQLTFLAAIGRWEFAEGKGTCVGVTIEIRLYERGETDWDGEETDP